jgi:hypothetical protein
VATTTREADLSFNTRYPGYRGQVGGSYRRTPGAVEKQPTWHDGGGVKGADAPAKATAAKVIKIDCSSDEDGDGGLHGMDDDEGRDHCSDEQECAGHGHSNGNQTGDLDTASGCRGIGCSLGADEGLQRRGNEVARGSGLDVIDESDDEVAIVGEVFRACNGQMESGASEEEADEEDGEVDVSDWEVSEQEMAESGGAGSEGLGSEDEDESQDFGSEGRSDDF